MRPTILSILASLFLAASAFSSEATPLVNLAFEYGFGASEYVAFGQAEKRTARLNHYSRANNLESFVITYQARRAFGDLAYRAGFFYSLNPLVIENSNGVRIHMNRISKYPDLVKRYNAIRPTNVEAIVSVVAECQGYGDFTKGTPVIRRLSFKINPLDLVYGQSRDGKDRAEPVVPLHLKDRVSLDHNSTTWFTSEDRTTDEELNKIFTNIIRVHDKTATQSNDVNVDIKIAWPDFEIERIAKDYESYEKEGKKAEKDYAFLKDPPKEKPYSGNEEMALPVDASAKPGEAFQVSSTKDKPWHAGIRVNGKVIFESEKIVRTPEPFDDKKTLFLVGMPDEIGSRLINTKGKWVQYEGYSRFILRDKRLVGIPDNPAPVYSSQDTYQSRWYPPITEAEFQAFKSKDHKRPPPRSEKPDPSKPVVWEYTFATYTIHFFRGEFLTLDQNNKKVIAREPAYFAQ
ncbi:MAG: hypothetical protein QM760_17205 [Nibricoccus sp.]